MNYKDIMLSLQVIQVYQGGCILSKADRKALPAY